MTTTATISQSIPTAVAAVAPSPGAQAALATGGYEFPGIPQIDDPYQKRQWQLEHMAGAFRVFARKGFTEGTSGHISVRDPVDPSTFWINPMGKHFGMLKASDMVHIDEAGQVIGGNQTAVNAAGFLIHSAIHRARPDIHAACHTHSPAGKAWSTFGRPLDILSQDTCNFWGTQAVYRAFGGVVLGAAEGGRIAAALGETGRVLVLQNHGLLTTGRTVDEAAYLFTLMERSCEVQIMVESAGLPKNLIADKEAEFTARVNADAETLYTEFQPDFEYEIWKSNGELCRGE
ncbi:class II aldolase and Adducin N-terminal domain protein [Aspergillus japonicus CBS 114.51]|uniref:Class II aldolase and Adducin N-terminal domain protein n=2 Tax=Aspergillus TaxID=5052 RepID=A0A2V5HYY0_ASPV1|nr:class II aldolase and Adducin N-terminal domain protein [Aspergillus japonicus CBS 114.51]PYI17047.1 class II aldolase and Adducin N-terminal domain protein [Aspergillus violaceofuscus CBS 115571]RAH81529.1 class II aldolase and Adducin N-terminal domain protein [Aspergillus japonicus CBS 114.51]